MEFKIITASSYPTSVAGSFEKAVQKHLSEGWKLYGNMCCCSYSSYVTLYQAMVRGANETDIISQNEKIESNMNPII